MKPIHSCYISHTSACAGWDIDRMLENTMYRKACSVSRFPKKDHNIKMLDWDFKGVIKKGFDWVWKKYLEIIQSYKFDVVMSPDSYVNSDPNLIIQCYHVLKEHCNRVVIPVHGYFSEYEGLELAYPNADGFNKVPKNYWLWNIREDITHILGGSPHKQMEIKSMLPNVITIDGNQMFNVAVRHGKFWEKGRWVVPEPRLTNKECFEKSLKVFELTLLVENMLVRI